MSKKQTISAVTILIIAFTAYIGLDAYQTNVHDSRISIFESISTTVGASEPAEATDQGTGEAGKVASETGKARHATGEMGKLSANLGKPPVNLGTRQTLLTLIG